jgi:glycerophosphoryl diester phosphodiesterase
MHSTSPRRTPLAALAALAATLAFASLPPLQAHAAQPTLGGKPAIVIAHRGASGYLPEHTLAAYELAVRMGADYIEPDLQMTRDGQLVAMHDATLDRTTDAAARFAPRNGGYRVADFSLEEIRTLAMRPQGTAKLEHPGFKPSSAHPLRVPTLEEVIALARRLEAQGARAIGLYPEAKQPGPRMANQILTVLSASGYVGADKVFIQSFDADTIRSLQRRQASMGTQYKLVLLNGSANRLLAMDLQRIARFAQGVGVSIRGEGMSQSFIAMAHAAGLAVHGYTFAEAQPVQAEADLRKHLNWGMDGVFSNYPDLARQAQRHAAGAR